MHHLRRKGRAAAQVNKKFTTIFFIHLKCYANTHEEIQEERGVHKGKKREEYRESEREFFVERENQK